MLNLREIRTVSLATDPMRLATTWPDDWPLMMIHSGRPHPRWARWSILARPIASWRFHERSIFRGARIVDLPESTSNDPLDLLDRILKATAHTRDPSLSVKLPFTGGWIGYISYDLGRVIEPCAQTTRGIRGARMDRPWPLIEMAYCPDALVYDNTRGVWYEIGSGQLSEQLRANESPVWSGYHPNPEIGTLRSSFDPDTYLDAIGRTIEYIEAGDVFQANITQRFSTPFSGSPRALWQAALACSQAWYGAYLEFDDASDNDARRIISVSPELFLQVNPEDRSVISRPIKGTRPQSIDPEVLRNSAKDKAELNMIIDLMRNDLGRVCEYGTVLVPKARAIESHPTVHHGVGEVTGTLRHNVTSGELLRATFPGGSVTGAPKIRAMQIIDELEPVRRGPYAGAVGYIDFAGNMDTCITLRTLVITPGDDGQWRVDAQVGAGIVADSQPSREYQ
ncbi:MAG: anthranilate synthase component I family protein, partial [Planctomycetes bacterium]|nr:anthranilate synthase component I family protein [Planctomycetota bacterium]